MQHAQTISRRAAAAVVAVAVAAVLAVGALAVSHSSDDSGLAARKLNPTRLAGGGKPVRYPATHS
jgi:hypothetical protein